MEMDTHWFEAEVAEAAVASSLDFHSCSHLLNRVIQQQYIKGWKIHVIHICMYCKRNLLNRFFGNNAPSLNLPGVVSNLLK